MYKPFNLTGKVVAVVGGNQGIGFGIAEALTQAGATVVIGGRRTEMNQQAAEKIGGDYIDVDATIEESVVNYMNTIVERHGRLDACFAILGGATLSPAPFDLTPLDWWEHDIKTNLTSVYLCFREASKHMIKLGNGGSLVSIASITSIGSSAYVSAYATAKAGLTGLTNSLCRKLGEYNIRINSIMSGVIATKESHANMPDQFRQHMIKHSVFNRLGEVEDFGGLAIYLASDASSYHTADVMLLDGGQTKTIMVV